MTPVTLHNDSPHKFRDISSEEWREYVYPEEEVLVIVKPQWLSVSDSGGHRVLDSQGISYYVAPGWLYIRWKAMPHFIY